MTKLKFDYVKIGLYKRPIITVCLSNDNQSINMPALIDSGADFNVFPLSIAKDLNIEINLDKPIEFSGVGEKSEKLIGFIGIVDMMIYSKGKNINFKAPIVFTNDIPSNGLPLLGGVGFFDHTEEITFLYKKGQVKVSG